jgi:hypothetical protein
LRSGLGLRRAGSLGPAKRLREPDQFVSEALCEYAVIIRGANGFGFRAAREFTDEENLNSGRSESVRTWTQIRDRGWVQTLSPASRETLAVS